MQTQFKEVIEIEIKKGSPARSPPIHKKLLKKHPTDLSREVIDQKLEKAMNIREELAKKIKRSDVKEVQDRKLNNEKQQHERVKLTLETRAEQALRLRNENLQTRIANAKKVIEKRDKVLQAKEELNQAQKVKLDAELNALHKEYD